MDLERARMASEKVAEKQIAERSRLSEQAMDWLAEDELEKAWNAWGGVWDRIAEYRHSRKLANRVDSKTEEAPESAVEGDVYDGDASDSGVFDSHELLSRALTRLFVAIKNCGLADSIPLALEKYDPSYCDGSPDEEEAYAVGILIDALADIAKGRPSGDVAADLLSLDPLPPLWRAGSARWLIYVAEHWPTRCEACGEIQSPEVFHHARCRDCSKPEGKLAQLVRHLRDTQPEREDDSASFPDAFPFWPEWRTALKLAFPGVRRDEELCDSWAAYLTEKLQLAPGRWQWIDLDEAGALLPPPPASVSRVNERSVEEESEERDNALPKTQRADAPSRIRARAAYEYAIERISGAHIMTSLELFEAIKRDGEAAAMLPNTAESFRRYLNDCGIRIKKSDLHVPGRSVVRQSDL